MIDGFYKYQAKPETVKKINAIRINQSRPDLCGVPILQPGQCPSHLLTRHMMSLDPVIIVSCLTSVSLA